MVGPARANSGSRIVIGLDIGTSGARAVAYDADGRAHAQATREYSLHTPHPRWAEQDPEEVVQAATSAVGDVVAQAHLRPENVAAIGLSSVLHSLVAMDADGQPLTGSLTWADARASAQSAALKAEFGDAFYRRTGCPTHPMYPLAKLRWLREEQPEVFARAHSFGSIKEYLLRRWLGTHLVDKSIASGSGLLNLHTGTWDEEILRVAGVDAERLGNPAEPTTAMSGLRPEFAEAMGIAADTPVVLGAGDGVLANLGVGAVAPGQMTCTIGTSGAVRLVSEQPRIDPKGRTWCYYLASDKTGERWVNGAAINNGGLVCRWVWEQLFGGSGGEEFDFDTLERWAAQSAPGARGLLFLPFLTGERSPYWNADARGVLFGLTISHTRDDIARAAFEGIGHRMRSIFLALEEVGGSASEIRATGGYTRSPFWLQLQSDILGRALVVPAVDEASAFGAAALAMLALGWLPSLDAVGKLVALKYRVAPDLEAHRRYAEMHELYMRVYWNLQREFTDVCTYQQ